MLGGQESEGGRHWTAAAGPRKSGFLTLSTWLWGSRPCCECSEKGPTQSSNRVSSLHGQCYHHLSASDGNSVHRQRIVAPLGEPCCGLPYERSAPRQENLHGSLRSAWDLRARLLPCREPLATVSALTPAYEPTSPCRPGVDDTEVIATALAADEATLVGGRSDLRHWGRRKGRHRIHLLKSFCVYRLR